MRTDVRAADDVREIRCLRERIDELEEENRQLKAALRPSMCFPATWKLWPREAKLLAALCRSPGCITYESLRIAMVGTSSDTSEKIVQVYLHYLRRKIGHLGIEVRVVRGTGLVLQPHSRAIVAAAVAAVASGEVA